MITFRGTYFDGKSSQAHAVTVSCEAGFVHIRGESGRVVQHEPLSGVEITAPLGQARRALQFPDGARCETDDLAAVAALDALRGSSPRMRLIHRLESHWRLVGTCLLGLVVSLWLFTTYGIPWIAKHAAYATPLDVLRGVSERSLALFDHTLFEPSSLHPARQAELQAQFAALTGDIGTHRHYRLVLRRSPKLGANALALPSGLIILTDELIALAQDDREILGVLAHEVGHVELRHGLRNIYQSAGTFLLLAMLAGDVTSMNSAAASLPTILIEMSYSRHFEREADAHAAAYMLRQGWGTQPLQELLSRLANEGSNIVPRFLSTHPGTAERLEHLQALEHAETWAQ